MGINGSVHERLRESWLIAFIVTVTTISYKVNQKILAKTVSIRRGHSGNGDASVNVICIHMDYRDLVALC